MRQNSGPQSAEKHVKEIRRRMRRKFSAEEKIRIVLAGLRGEAVVIDEDAKMRLATHTESRLSHQAE